MNHTLLRHFTSLFLIISAALQAEVPAKKLAPVLQPYVDRQTLAGAVVLVADPDKVLDVEAVGFEDVAAKKPMQTNSMFWIASQSKPITAAAFMILVDEGKVNVDDPVEKYLPEFKGQKVNISSDPKKPELVAPRHPILVREVLSHTSGLDFKSPMETPTRRWRCCSSPAANPNTPTRASTPLGASSKWSAAWRMKPSSPNGSSSLWA